MRTRLLSFTLSLIPLACADKAGDETDAATTTAATSSSSSGITTGEIVDPPDATTTTTATPTTSGVGSNADDGSEVTSLDPATSGDASSEGGEVSTSDDTGVMPIDCTGSLPAGDHMIEIQHSSGKRTALLHVPPGLDADTPAPLIFNFHGFTMDGEGEQAFSRMDTLADAEGILVVYPDGLGNSWNAGACCGNAMSQGVDDVDFVRALHAHLATQVCFDPKRVYSTGMSNGGFLTNRLACEAADLFAAFGPVSAVNGMTECTPSRPVPIVAFNGTNDLLVAYGGVLYIGVAASFAGWAERNGCVGDPEPGTEIGAASCLTYKQCDGGVQVTQCTIEGMGHCWPGNPTCAYGTPNTDLDANAEMWALFSQYSLP